MKDPLDDAPKKDESAERPKPLHELEEVPAPIRKVLGGLDRMARGPQRNHLTRAQRHYAGFHDRLMANVLDFFVIFILLTPVFTEINGWIYSGEDFSAASVTGQDQQVTAEYVKQSGFVENLLKTYAAQTVILGFIYVYFWANFSATPGKLLIGLKIVDSETEQPISMSDAVHRYLGLLISLPPFMLGFLWLNFTKKHQAWHDYIGGTVVIYTERNFWGNVKAVFSWAKAKITSKKAP